MNYRVILQAALFIVFSIFCVEGLANDEIDMVQKLGIKEEVVKLDSLISRKVKKNHYLSQFGDLRHVHIFVLSFSDDEKIITKKNWLDYSFLDDLRPNYFRIRNKRFGKKYLKTLTYLVDKNGYRISVFINGFFYMCASEMPKDLLNEEKNLFMFLGSFDPQLKKIDSGYYIVLKDNKLYGFDDWSDNENLVPLETYVKQRF